MAEGQPLLILFGSQTGNAQDVAERIAREARARHYSPRVQPMDAYDVHLLPEEAAVVFVTSTTGQGELPSNMRAFWRFLLRKNLPADSLSGVSFAAFGLGDSGYLHYNVVAKKLARRLQALGASPCTELGLGDDQHPQGYEAALDPWLSSLWSALRSKRPLPPGSSEPAPGDTATLLHPKYQVSSCEAHLNNGGSPALPASGLEHAVAAARAFNQVEAAASGFSGRSDDSAQGFGPWQPYMAPVLKNERVTAEDHFQDTRHIELSLEDSGMTHEPGALLAVFPQQDPRAVAAFCKVAKLDPDAWIRVAPAESLRNGHSSSMQARVGDVVAGVLDVSGASPRRFFFEVLRQFSADPVEVDRLTYFASPDGREALAQYNQREGRTVLEALEDFTSARVPLQWLLQVVPRLQPRYFSIASSLAAHPGQVHILAALVDYQTPHRRHKQGVCSAWLAGLQPGKPDARVPVWVEPGVMRLPAESASMIMVGPGTGVAPFRAMLEQRAVQQSQGHAVAPSYLYFGSRNRQKDYYYGAFWEQCQESGVLAQEGGLVTAFSRDQPKKVYVQHRIRENAATLWAALQQGAVVFVCGSASKMPQDVLQALQQVLRQEAGMTAEDAAAYLKRLELTGRYITEAWS
ncbi:g8237 [Coccomyxa viridis]|uniref:NADPH-dependent diflavin oxidoreductase 1 n=1 Tax=Coccomyxa viridis TaxID=1274662 RepID=A0ABP1G6L3_9CHLO